MSQRRTMQSCPNSKAVLRQLLRHILAVQPLHIQRQHTALTISVRLEQPDVFRTLQTADQPAAKTFLMEENPLYSGLFHKPKSLKQSAKSRHIVGAGFPSVRKEVRHIRIPGKASRAAAQNRIRQSGA